MGDTEGALPPSKKRVAGRDITRDNPGFDDDEGPEPEMGTFQRASEEVLATRRIVKVKRHQKQSEPSSNPFAGICLVAPPKPDDETNRLANEQQMVAEKTVLEVQDGANSEDTNTNKGKVTENGDIVDGECVTENNVLLKASNDETPVEDAEKNKTDAVEEVVSRDNDKEAQNEKQECKGEAVEETERETNKESQEDKDENKEVGVEIKEPKETGKDVAGTEKQDGDQKDKAEPTAPLNSFQQLSNSQNAFTGLAGTGFSGSAFSFGSVSKEGSAFGTGSGSLFGKQTENSSFPSFGFGSSNNGSSSLQLFGVDASDATKGGGSVVPAMQEVPVETGEENEKVVFNADAIVFEYLDGGWKERGKGELKVNVSSLGTEKARLVMRARGNYRLILNASLYPDMSLKNMDKRGITFACVNSAGEGKGGLTTFALKFKDSSIVEEFRGAVAAYKGRKDTALKTPENSPKTSDD